MIDEHKWLYTAVLEYAGHPLGEINRTVTADSYKKLVLAIEEANKELRYTTGHVGSYQQNDGPFFEAYTSDLIWPELKWDISREEVDVA